MKIKEFGPGGGPRILGAPLRSANAFIINIIVSGVISVMYNVFDVAKQLFLRYIK